MGHGHSHTHAPAGSASSAGRHRWRLAVSFGLVLAFFVVELIAGLSARSLALISDAGHMAADVVTLGAALVATRIAVRPDTTGRRTFGSYRAEVFASALAVLLMLGVSIYTGVEAIVRIGSSHEAASGVMLAVGALGLVINGISILLLQAGAKESLNVRGAYLEVLADSLGSLGVVAAALLVRWTAAPWWDSVVAVAISVFVAVRAVSLGREVVAVLGQHAPSDVEPREVLEALEDIDGVTDVHDLHVWQLTSGMNVATAHLVAASSDDGDAAPDEAGGAVLVKATTVLRERFHIAHATLQVESAATAACHETDW